MFTCKIHCNLSCESKFRCPFITLKVFNCKSEIFCNDLLYRLYAYWTMRSIFDYILEPDRNILYRHRLAVKFRTCYYPVQGTFKFSDIARNIVSQEKYYLLGNIKISRLRFFLKYGYPCFIVWWLYICYQSPFETADKSVLYTLYFFRRSVRTYDDLFF